MKLKPQLHFVLQKYKKKIKNIKRLQPSLQREKNTVDFFFRNNFKDTDICIK